MGVHWYPHFTVGVEINGRLRSLYYKLPFTNISAFYSFNKKLTPEQIKEFENKDNFTITWTEDEYGDAWYPSNVGWHSRAKIGDQVCDEKITLKYTLCKDANLEISVFCGNKNGLGFCLLAFDFYTFFDNSTDTTITYPYIRHSNSKIPQREGGYTFVLDISGDKRKEVEN